MDIDYMVRAVRPDGSWTGSYGLMNRYRVDLGGTDGSYTENVELSQKPETPAPQVSWIFTGQIEPSNHGPKFRKAQQQSDQAKASRPRSSPPQQAQGGGGGGWSGGGTDDRQRSITIQTCVKASVEMLHGTPQGTDPAHVLATARALADGCIAYAEQAPAQAAAPPAQQPPQQAPQAQQAPPPAQAPGPGQYGGQAAPQGGGFGGGQQAPGQTSMGAFGTQTGPDGGDDEIPF